jgi:hypothetical protein
LGQHPPKLQFHVEPLIPHTLPKGDREGGHGEFGGEVFHRVIRVDNDHPTVIHGCSPVLLGSSVAYSLAMEEDDLWQAFVSLPGKLSCADGA